MNDERVPFSAPGVAPFSGPNDFEQRLSLDPLIVEATADVDTSLFDWTLSMAPLERLDACHGMTSFLLELRDAASQGR